MMEIIIIYDSYFGNTLKVAEMFQSEFATGNYHALIKHCGQASLEDIQRSKLVLLGSPTRGFRESPAMMSFLKRKDICLKDKRVFAFDTRISIIDIKSKLLRRLMKRFGYAATNMEKRLKKNGVEVVMPATGYPVVSVEGPLKSEVASMIENDAQRLLSALYGSDTLGGYPDVQTTTSAESFKT
ncbi:MAG: flavodoxin family protein [Candidatus Izemoplasmatales bacterium]|jgi:flavodoxin